MTATAADEAPSRTAAQAQASRHNGALSRGRTTPAGKARAALNGTRHGLCSQHFFLLPDEDPRAFALFVADQLALLRPRDAVEHQAAERATHARWRLMRADRLEAEILAELFAAKALPDALEARAVRAAQTRALATLLRYRSRIQRDIELALREFAALRTRPLDTAAASTTACTSEPEPARRPLAAVPPSPEPPTADAGGLDLAVRLSLNRHERRRLAALERQAA